MPRSIESHRPACTCPVCQAKQGPPMTSISMRIPVELKDRIMARGGTQTLRLLMVAAYMPEIAHGIELDDPYLPNLLIDLARAMAGLPPDDLVPDMSGPRPEPGSPELAEWSRATRLR